MQLKFVQKWMRIEIERVVRFFNLSKARVRYSDVHYFQVFEVKKKSRNPIQDNSSLHASVSFYKYGIRTGISGTTTIINFDRTYSYLLRITFILTTRNLDERNISRSLKKVSDNVQRTRSIPRHGKKR